MKKCICLENHCIRCLFHWLQSWQKNLTGKLRISYSGGADYFNIRGIVEAGIWPVTLATTILKPGGYERLLQIAEETEMENVTFDGVSPEASQKLADDARINPIM